MGQQQLLLLVLGIVIVGLAVVAGINAFQENQTKSEQDAIVNEGMRIATDVQAYRLKPDQLGGGGGSFPENLEDAISNTSGSDTYDTPWGMISYSKEDPPKLTLTPDNSSSTAKITISSSGSPTLSKDFGSSSSGSN